MSDPTMMPTQAPGAPSGMTPLAHAAMFSGPSIPYTLSTRRHGTHMAIGDWVIESTKRAIYNNAEIEALEKELNLPLPEMTFGNNKLVLNHTSGVSIVFDAVEALRAVPTGEGWEERVGGGVLVSMAEAWSKGRSASSVLSDMPITKPVRPHDWTYSSTYAGSSSGASFVPTRSHAIPLPLLARQDPVLDRILYYDDVTLFEDELHDHGDSTLHVRIRVMPHCFFILSRAFVRVDNVLFRIFDVRVYHAFGSTEVVRECSGLEADYDTVKSHLEKPDDLSPLTDPNFVYATLGAIAAETHAPEEGPHGLQAVPPHSSQTKKPWPGLGKRVDVLTLENVHRDLERLAL